MSGTGKSVKYSTKSYNASGAPSRARCAKNYDTLAMWGNFDRIEKTGEDRIAITDFSGGVKFPWYYDREYTFGSVRVDIDMEKWDSQTNCTFVSLHMAVPEDGKFFNIDFPQSVWGAYEGQPTLVTFTVTAGEILDKARSVGSHSCFPTHFTLQAYDGAQYFDAPREFWNNSLTVTFE
jgi:hypothetical protein